MNISSRENFINTVRCEGSEQVPVFLRDLTLGLDAIGIRTTDVFGKEYDHKESAKAILGLQNIVGHDAVVGCIHTYSVEAFGGVTKYPEWGIPYLSEPPFVDIDVMEGSEPYDVDDALLEGMSLSYRTVREKAPDLAVVLNVGGPVNTAGNLRGIEQFLMDIYTDPDLAKRIVDFSTDVMKVIIEKSIEHTDAVFLAAASDNPDMLGPESFERYVIPSVKEITDMVHTYDEPVIFHPHGVFSTDDRRDMLKLSLSTGIDGFQFAEDNEPEGILKETKGRCSILGGVDAFTTLLLGPEERIVRDTNRFMDVLGNEDYVSMCSCSLHRGLPIQNVKTMTDAVRSWGK